MADRAVVREGDVDRVDLEGRICRHRLRRAEGDFSAVFIMADRGAAVSAALR